MCFKNGKLLEGNPAYNNCTRMIQYLKLVKHLQLVNGEIIMFNFEILRFISKANNYKTMFAQQTHVNKRKHVAEQK